MSGEWVIWRHSDFDCGPWCYRVESPEDALSFLSGWCQGGGGAFHVSILDREVWLP